MKKIAFISALSMLLSLASYAQVGIGTTTPHASSVLDLVSSSKGFLAPRMDSTHRKAISGAADGLMVYDSSYHSYWFWKHGSWDHVLGSTTGWSLTGNGGTDTTVNFLGTTDSLPLILKTKKEERMRITPSGKVGIGKIPSVPFDLLGASRFEGDASFYGNFMISQSLVDPPGPTTQFYNGLSVSSMFIPHLSGDIILSKEELSISTPIMFLNNGIVHRFKFNLNGQILGNQYVLDLWANNSADIISSTLSLINAKFSNTSMNVDCFTGLKMYFDNSGSITNAAGIIIPDLSGVTNDVNILLGTSTIPTGEYSIYNASVNPNYYNGSVGIGTTSPTHPLHVSAASDPLRLEGLQSTLKDTLLVVSGSGVVSKRPFSSFDLSFWSLSGNSGTTPGTNYLGTADNKDLVIKANNTERMKILSSGEVRIGNGANYTKVETDGTLEFDGNATVWKDFVVPGTTGKTGTTPLSSPSFEVFKNNGFGSAGVWLYMFQHPVATEESLLFTLEMPHDWKENTTINPHVHWSPMTGAAGNVSWGIEYTWIDITGAFGNTMFATATTATAGISSHQVTSLGPINPNLGQGHISSILCVRLYRNIAQDTYPNKVALLSLDIHYEANTVGSRTELTK